MENDLQRQIDDLKNEINNLKSASSFPVEIKNALNGIGFIRYTDNITIFGGASGNPFRYINAEYSGKKAIIPISSVKSFSVDVSSNTCTSIGHGLVDGNQVYLFSTKTLPGGLDSVDAFYILNDTTDTFQLSSDGINVKDITDVGVGTHYFEFLT